MTQQFEFRFEEGETYFINQFSVQQGKAVWVQYAVGHHTLMHTTKAANGDHMIVVPPQVDFDMNMRATITIQFPDKHRVTYDLLYHIKNIDGSKPDVLGRPGGDKLTGTGGDDTIDGVGGKDRINGGDGDDVILAGLGNDVLKGGKGSDHFMFSLNGGHDIITDYNIAQDSIDDMNDVQLKDHSKLVHNGHDTLVTYEDGSTFLLQGVNIFHAHATE